jgi:hypothetical protein
MVAVRLSVFRKFLFLFKGLSGKDLSVMAVTSPPRRAE